MELTWPQRDQTWNVDSSHYVLWTSDPSVASHSLRLQFSADDGRNWAQVATVTAGEGKFLWRVPPTVAESCRVRLSDPRTGIAADSEAFETVASQQVSDYRWSPVTLDGAFASRDGAGALVFDGRMWLIGGWHPGHKDFPKETNNEVWSSADGVRWTLEKANTFAEKGFDPARDWEGRHCAGYAVYKDRMWIIGGDGNQRHYQNDVWTSADGRSWTCVNKDRTPPWAPRVMFHAVVFEDRIWILGGQTVPQAAPSGHAFFNDAWTTTDGVNWRHVAPKAPSWPSRGLIGGSAVFNGRIWILGGGTYETPQFPQRKYYSDVWSSADGVNWRCHSERSAWNARQYHDVAVFDGRLWVMEGADRVNRNDVWYSRDGVNWYELPDTPWKPRHAASVFMHAGALWMVAGNNMESDVWKLSRAGGGPPSPEGPASIPAR